MGWNLIRCDLKWYPETAPEQLGEAIEEEGRAGQRGDGPIRCDLGRNPTAPEQLGEAIEESRAAGDGLIRSDLRLNPETARSCPEQAMVEGRLFCGAASFGK